MWRMTLASLRAHRLRLLLTAATVVIGVAFVAGTFLLTDSLQRTIQTGTAVPDAGGVVITPAASVGGKPGGQDTVPAGLLTTLRAAPGVAAAEGLVTADKVTLIGKDHQPIRHTRAINELRSYPTNPALAAQYTLRSGRAPRAAGEALLDAATAVRLGYRLGDPITVLTPGGPRTLTVVGVTGFDGAASPVGDQVAFFDTPTVVIVPVGTAQRLAGLPGGYTEIDVRAASGVTATVLRDRLTPLLPAGIQAGTAENAAARQAAAAQAPVANLRTDLLACCAIALVVAALVIANTFAILTAQRVREHALLRVIGASRGQLLRSALAEAGAVGLAASVVGLGFGVLAAVALRGLIGLLGGVLPTGGLVLTVRTALVALAVGTVVTVLAAFGPARRAVRVAPLRALREATTATTRPGRSRTLAGAAGVLVGAGLIVAGLTVAPDPGLPFVGAGALVATLALLMLGPWLVGPFARLLTAGCHRIARLAADNAIRSPRRTAATAATLTLGIATALAIGIISGSTQAAAQGAVTSTSHADGYLNGTITPDIAATIAARPGVGATMRLDTPLVTIAGATTRIAGIDPAGAAALLDLGTSPANLAALHTGGLLVSASQAERHHWRVGDVVTVDFGSGPHAVPVVGTFTDKRFLGDDYLMSITALFRDMPDQQDTANTILIQAAHGRSPAALPAALEPVLLAHPDLTLQTPAGYQAARATDLGDLNHVLGGLTALVVLTLVIATLGIANALALSLTERVRELGLLRALGATRRQLATMVHIESLITGLLGALPGVALGTGTGIAIATTLTRDQTGLATVRIPLTLLIIVVGVGCLTAVVAAGLPAHRAGRMGLGTFVHSGDVN